MAKIVIAGDAVVVTSALKLEDIHTIEKYRPKALVLKGGEDGKEPIFAIGTTSGAGNINEVGASFGRESHDEGKLATVTMVIGSTAVSDPDLVRAAVARYGDRIAVGIDTKNGRVRTAGWVEDSGLDYLVFAKQMEQLGVGTIIFTDIDTDGALSGPSYARLSALQKAVSCRIIASGGVSCNQDIEQLNRMGLYGAIIGKAYYAGTIDLAQAVREGGEQ